MSEQKCYVIKLGFSDPHYIAKWNGDPGRTYAINSALKFLSRNFAEIAARKVIAKYPNRYDSQTHFEIEEIEAD